MLWAWRFTFFFFYLAPIHVPVYWRKVWFSEPYDGLSQQGTFSDKFHKYPSNIQINCPVGTSWDEDCSSIFACSSCVGPRKKTQVLHIMYISVIKNIYIYICRTPYAIHIELLMQLLNKRYSYDKNKSICLTVCLWLFVFRFKPTLVHWYGWRAKCLSPVCSLKLRLQGKSLICAIATSACSCCSFSIKSNRTSICKARLRFV